MTGAGVPLRALNAPSFAWLFPMTSCEVSVDPESRDRSAWIGRLAVLKSRGARDGDPCVIECRQAAVFLVVVLDAPCRSANSSVKARDQIGGPQARRWSPRRATIRDRSDRSDRGRTRGSMHTSSRSDGRDKSHLHPHRPPQRAVGRPLCFTDDLYAPHSGHELAEYRPRLHPRELCPQA